MSLTLALTTVQRRSIRQLSRCAIFEYQLLSTRIWNYCTTAKHSENVVLGLKVKRSTLKTTVQNQKICIYIIDGRTTTVTIFCKIVLTVFG